MRHARSWKATAILCTLVGLVSVALVAALARGDDGSNTASSSSPYRLVCAVSATGDNWYTHRINKITGATFYINGTAWTKIVESGQPPAGDYDLAVMAVGSGNNAADEVVRIDRKTGTTWTEVNGNWTLITEPQ